MKIMIFNGLLLFLLFMWTSAETGPETVLTEEIQVYANESRVDIQARKRACENLGGKCIKKKKDCPSRWHLETKPGKPYCSKNHRCCYPGPSCNLVWNYKEERPLIMIRDSKIIVPPVLDIEVSDNPSRIPIGRKLIFACPGKNNQFNHVEGTHTQLHGECISHEQFKVCVNSNPEILDLSQLSCSRKMFPSFIKDNTTSDKKSCDGIGGELYKTGYTYGDYHEFKDLEIEVCFTKNNQTTLCASSNLHGNETDYRNAKKDSQQKMPTVGQCGGGGVSGVQLDKKLKIITEQLMDIDKKNKDNKRFENLVVNLPDSNAHQTKPLIKGRPEFLTGPTTGPLVELQTTFLHRHRIDITETPDNVKITSFLNAIMRTEVMKTTETFLKDNGLIANNKYLVNILRVMWFTLYSRYPYPSPGTKVASSCGFEHVFVGEVSKAKLNSIDWRKVKGFHNWIYYFSEQRDQRMEGFIYEGENHKLDLGEKRLLLNLKFYWSGYDGANSNIIKYKPKGSTFFMGTSPELEMAVYTICFLAKPNANGLASPQKCAVKMGGKEFDIMTNYIADDMLLDVPVGNQFPNAKDLVGGAHIEI